MRIAVGILEKSRRLRTARFSLGIRYSSGPVMRGREEAPSGSYGAPELPMLPRRADSASFGKDATLWSRCTACGVQRGFRLRGGAQQGYASALPGRNSENPVRERTICAAIWRERRGREVPGKGQTPAETRRPTSATTELCTVQ